MADYPLEFYRRSEQQWRRRTIRPLAPIEDAETPMRRSNQCPQCCIMATEPFVSTYRPGVENTPAPFSRTSHRQRLRGIELSITAPRTFRARVNHYAAMRAALKTLPSPTVRQAQPVSG